MAVKDEAGPRPAAQSAKRCFLNCLKTSFKPCFYLPSCSANCQLACVVLQLAFVLHGSGQGTPSQGSNTMAAKDGAGPRPAAQTAKRCFLNCLKTSFKPCFYLPSCSANCQLAMRRLAAGFCAARLRSRDPPAGPKHHGSDGRSGVAAGSPDCQTLLSELPRNWLQTLLLLALLLCQLPTCLRRLAAGFCAARLWSRDPLAGLKHHGSEGRSGPAAGSPECQTLLSELPANLPASSCSWLSCCTAPVKGPPRRAQTPCRS